jgi:hypothetical protein
MYRDTGQIQSQGFDRVWWGICRPQPHHATDWKARLAQIAMGRKKQNKVQKGIKRQTTTLDNKESLDTT